MDVMIHSGVICQKILLEIIGQRSIMLPKHLAVGWNEDCIRLSELPSLFFIPSSLRRLVIASITPLVLHSPLSMFKVRRAGL